MQLADKAPEQATQSRDWRAFVETGFDGVRLRDGQGSQLGERVSLDGFVDGLIAPSLRYVVSDRLDLEQSDHPDARDNYNTLKEAYLSWQLSPEALLDAGRINLRYGVALGYNPTDFFRGDAIRSIVSLDPSSLRENRQGSVVVQGQALSDSGSVSVLFSPKINTVPTTAEFSPDWGATNSTDRWLIVASQKVSEQFSPQLLVLGQSHESAQLGANLSGLLGNATTGYLEWTGGEGPTLLGSFDPAFAQDSFHQRAAFGATYATDFKLSVTLEYELNTAGLDGAQFHQLAQGHLSLLGPFLEYSTVEQDLPITRAWFMDLSWSDLAIQHLDISSFVRFDPVTHSHLTWGELRYHWDRADLALQVSWYGGASHSLFGLEPDERTVTVLLRYFL